MTTLRMMDASGQAQRPPQGERITIGVDLARNKCAHAVYWGGKVQRQLVTPGGGEHVPALVREYHPAYPVRLVYEACGFGYELAWWAHSEGIEVVVAAPSRIERVPGTRVKTDRLDACTLATKGAAQQLKGIAIPSRTQHEQRQVLRTYGQAIRDRSRARARLRSLCQEHGRLGPLPRRGWGAYERWLTSQSLPAPLTVAVAELRALHAAASASVVRLRAALRAYATSAEHRAVVSALTTQAGVAELTAIRLLLEIGDPRPRFHSVDAWVNSLGLTPSEYSTGSAPAHRGHIQKCGTAPLRATLVQSAWVAIRTDRDLRATFERLAPRAGKKRAIIAVARRLAKRLRARWLAALGAPSVVAV